MNRFWNDNVTLAFQWSAEELQWVLAKRAGESITVIAADSECLADGASAEVLARHLQSVLSAHGVRRASAIVVLGRSHVDLLPLELPQATDDELPALVEFQAGQALPETAADGMLDFVPLYGDGNGCRKALACVMKKQTSDFIESVCRECRLQVRMIGVRPLSVASFLERMPASNSPIVVITPFVTEADLTIYYQNRLAIARTVRLPSATPHEQGTALAAEIRRSMVTMSVVPDEEGDSCEVHMFGSTEHPPELQSTLDEALQTTIQMFDPFSVVEHQPHSLESNWPPDSSGTFAPLVGMLKLEQCTGLQVDFLHPRRPPVPANPRRRYAAYAVAIAALIGLASWFVYQGAAEQQEEIADLTRQIDSITSRADKLASKQEVVAAVAQWQQDDITWLDELNDFTERFPAPDQAYVQRLSLSTDGRDAGIIELQIRVQDPAHLESFETRLRDRFHSIQSKRVAEQEHGGEFGWQFESTIIVRKRTRDEYNATAQSTTSGSAR